MLQGRWEIEARLGEGAIGETFRALDRVTGERVTLKVLRAGVPLEPLRHEFLVLRELSHPSLAAVRDFGVVNGRGFLTCAFVEGSPMATPEPRVIVDVLEALSFLHAHGTVHGDVKAENVIVSGGRGVLIDLGCARAPGRYADVHGTPDHLSPEARRGELGPEADVYALGVTLERLGMKDDWVERMRAADPARRPTADELLDLLSTGRSRVVAVRRTRRIGLEHELARVQALVQRLQQDDEGARGLLFRGPTGSGRSRALLEAKWLAQASIEVVEGRVPHELVARALGEPAIAGRARIVDGMERLAKDATARLLCLDDVDALSPHDRRDLALVTRLARGRVGVLLAGDLELPELEELPLSPWTREELEEWLGDRTPTEGLTRLLLRSGGRPGAVRRIVGELPSATLTAETVDRRSIEPTRPTELDPEQACAWARELEEVDPARALSVVARALRKRPPAPWPARLRRIGATCALRRGEAKKAVMRLRALFSEDESVGPDLALALLRVGAYAESAEVIARAMPSADDDTRAELACTQAFVDAYRGREPDFSALEGRSLRPRTRFRYESARAFVLHRHGKSREAAARYRAALEIAEEASLDDLLVPAALNAGTAAHQAGDLGSALRAYERGLQLAHAFGAVSTAVTLDFDLGKLLADVGAVERARIVAERARAAARREGMTFVEGACVALLAEIAALAGDRASAREHLAEARRRLEARDLLEVDLQALELEPEGDPAPLLARARELAAPDLEARARKIRGERRRDAAELETALELARGQELLCAEIEVALAETWRALGAGSLADAARARAREGFERASATLPPPLARAFREHPRRRAVFTERRVDSREVERLRHLVAINRRLGAATTTSEVLEATLDAAIELVSAERGFLLLREARGHRVAVAKNLDRERIGRSHLKFSRAIAQRVVETGEPLITVDAEDDSRLRESRSVHAMRLKSILCVPIGDGVGAIYLDHRFRAGAFAGDDLEIVRAFADQAAIALARARLLDELRQKNEQLERERTAIAQVAEDRAQQLEALTRAEPRHPYAEIIGRGPAMRRMLERLDRVIDTDVTVLVTGESGTGKELVARAIHQHSPRKEAPFRAINCGAVPEALLEAELFGVRKGAFTGATRDHDGLFVAARGGTVFLDELGEMPLAMQVKLLRVLQEREVRPLGSNETVPVDVRVVSATNRDLRAEIAAGRFREDLFYRVAVMTVETPPLRERVEDLPALIDALLERAARATRRAVPRIDRDAERALLRHRWPGNVRELENVLTKALLMCDGVIREEDLSLSDRVLATPARPRGATPGEKARFRAVLEATGWNVCEAARTLNVPRATFYRKLQRYGLERP